MADPPHVLILLHQLGSGGVERVTLHLANGLVARGNRVTLALLRRGGVLEERLSPAVELRTVGTRAPKHRGLGLLAAAGPLAKLVRREGPDLLLSPGNHAHALALLAHRMAGVRGCRLALKFTNPIERRQAGAVRNALRRAFFRHAAARSDLILTLSATAGDQAAAIAPGAADKFRIVDNPYVEERLLDRGGSAALPKDEPPLLLSVGRLIAQKDPLMLIEALGGLKDRPWRLAMLGEGPLRAECEAKVRALGLADRVEFAGFVPDPSTWFERARLFLLSSRYEELPAVLLEAMVGRCAIVSTAASPSVVQLLDGGRLGHIVAPGDVAAFRAAIGQALDDPAPPAQAADWVERFTIGNGVASHAQALGLR